MNENNRFKDGGRPNVPAILAELDELGDMEIRLKERTERLISALDEIEWSESSVA